MKNENSINPFDINISNDCLKNYLDNADVNIKNSEGLSLIEYWLKRENYRNYDLCTSIVKMLSNPDCFLEKQTSQDSLHSYMIGLHMTGLKTVIEKKTFINRFDLKSINLIDRNGLNHHKNYPSGWLTYFLFTSEFDFFLNARKFNPDYQEGLKIRDGDGNNCWHAIGYYLVANMTAPETRKKCYDILNILKDECGQGLQEVNRFNETPLQTVFKRACVEKDPKSPEDIEFQEQIKYTQKFFTNMTLEMQLPKKDKVKKLKI